VGEIVAPHTQLVREPAASAYLAVVARTLVAARLSKAFPDRRRIESTLDALASHQGLYDGIFIDSRAGLPNLASFTRVLADKSVGLEALERPDDTQGRGDDELWQRLARKRRYFEKLASLELAPVDEHRVLLRRQDPRKARASFRVELTKLQASGCYIRVVVELEQEARLWGQLVDVDAHGEVAQGTEELRAMIYRFANFDAETLFVRMHELEGVRVERVQRGILGPLLFSVPVDHERELLLEPERDALGALWAAFAPSTVGAGPQVIACFATDTAALDVPTERSNDPLAPLLADSLVPGEQARYRALRERFGFRVFKDRKFVASDAARPLVDGLCASAGTKNVIYPLR
jgi:hypothetical protein